MKKYYIAFICLQRIALPLQAINLESSLQNFATALNSINTFFSSIPAKDFTHTTSKPPIPSEENKKPITLKKQPEQKIPPKNTEQPLSIEKQVLHYTNEFRAQQGELPLLWNQTLADLAQEHSYNMAQGTIPFGHAGFFEQRIPRYPPGYKGAAENVYMTSMQQDLAHKAVTGWINSEGHRKNLLGKYNQCGIGIYKNKKNHWYVTQLFGLF